MEKILFPALYQAHCDLSKTGCATGLVIAHIIGARKIARFDASEMKQIEELKPVIRVDLVLRIIPPPHGEIDIPRVRAIIYELNRRHGMQFGKITFDIFGSQESIKSLRDEGFNAAMFSVDRDITAYETLRTAMYDGRLLCYRVPVLERELAQLEFVDMKVDHPGSAGAPKDLADALAAVVYHCEESWRAGEGSRGMFKLGALERPGELLKGMEQEIADIYRKVVGGEPLSDADVLFGQNKSGRCAHGGDLQRQHGIRSFAI